MTRLLFALCLCFSPCLAQRLFVYSPLTRIDPFGAVVAADRGAAEPRHILSPGIPRNASTPLRIVVDMDKPDYYYLEVGQNPENAVKAKLYKEIFVETAAGWVPDSLQEVSNPYRGFPTDFRLPGQKVVTFWVEMYVSPDAPVDRIKVEPQLYIDAMKEWTVYPMEVRVQSPVVPYTKSVPDTSSMPPATMPADAPLRGALKTALCTPGAASPPSVPASSGQLTSRELLRRYIEQDLRLVKDKVALQAAFLKAFGRGTVQSWCDTPSTPAAGPEWYLRLRDAIYRDAGAVN